MQTVQPALWPCTLLCPPGNSLLLRLVQGVSINCMQNSLKQAHLISSPSSLFKALSKPPSREGAGRREEEEVLFLCGFSIKKQVSPTYGEAMQPWLGALTIGTACSLQPVGPASGIPIICWAPLLCGLSSERAASQQPFCATIPHSQTTADRPRSGHW